ncbi:MAG: polysaccharide export protein [Alteraurantiacibacter sp. bin_em_oilr2.035]|uniref:polysaccharide biosynthesis/export family protein n=1 Tax=Aurantiacibacter atlanticus TaxID=1648404 RepID=UPI000AD6D645|nr:polysaccharide biosynthesis/export family protein [Aurantiacibacter atlanticus]MDF1835962.1 polysaccharide export protein [Alteraurantiacibacter sp. bin_em_oilr2.035]
MKWQYFPLAGIASLLLSACASGPDVTPGIATSQPVSTLGQDRYQTRLEDTYAVRPADVISVSVFREAEMSVDRVPISAAGNVSLPLIGTLSVGGMTPAQIEEVVERKLRTSYLRHPEVSVNVIEYASHMVTVEGSVKDAGLYRFQPGTRLSGGISLAGGPERTADIEQIAVFRDTPEGIHIAKFDYRAVQSGQMLDPVLQPGDRIVVGTDSLSVLWQDALRAIPAFALFTRF